MNKITTTLFAQLINLLPRDILASIASEYARPGNATKYSVWDQLVALVFCHIAGCDSLREIEDGMYSALGTLNHALGAQPLKRSTLAYANGKRDYHIFERYYFALLEHFKKLFEFELPNSYAKPTFAIDSTTITLCMKLFPWAQYTSTKGGIKLHTALDLSTGLPVVMNMTSAKVHDSKATREIINRLPKFSVVVMDRGYNDYELFEELSLRGTKFVTRLKENAQTSTLAKVAEDEENGDWGVYRFRFTSEAASKRCGDREFHLVQWHDLEHDRWFNFLTNDLDLTAEEVATLYRDRWKIELFFKKLKQNLYVKSFIGTNENAVMSQSWTAAIVTLVVECLYRRSKYPWHFSRFFKFLQLNLMTFKELMVWIDRPDLASALKNNTEGPLQLQLFSAWGACFRS